MKIEQNTVQRDERFSIVNVRISVIFVIATAIYLLLIYIFNNFLMGKEVYIRSFSDQYTMQFIDSILETRNNNDWLSVILIPVMLVLKTFYTVLWVSVGTIIALQKFEFKTVFKVTLISETIFIIAQIIYLFNLFLNKNYLTVQTQLNYFPLSILSIYGSENVVPWLHYPLQTLNLFEVAYVLCIAWLLSKQWKPDFVESLNIVIPSYGIGLLVWMVLVVFLTLQVS